MFIFLSFDGKIHRDFENAQKCKSSFRYSTSLSGCLSLLISCLDFLTVLPPHVTVYAFFFFNNLIPYFFVVFMGTLNLMLLNVRALRGIHLQL